MTIETIMDDEGNLVEVETPEFWPERTDSDGWRFMLLEDPIVPVCGLTAVQDV